jgi:hypothetical protein
MRRGDVPEAVRHAARLNYEAGRADALAGRTDEWAIELHLYPPITQDEGWRLLHLVESNRRDPGPWTDEQTARSVLEVERRGYGNEGKDWARLVHRTVSPWTQVED